MHARRQLPIAEMSQQRQWLASQACRSTVVRASSDLLGKCVERGRCESLSVWRLSKSHTIRRPAGCYAHMPADSLDGRQATFSGPGRPRMSLPSVEMGSLSWQQGWPE